MKINLNVSTDRILCVGLLSDEGHFLGIEKLSKVSIDRELVAGYSLGLKYGRPFEGLP